MTGTDSAEAAAALRGLLRDAFTRLIEHADELTDGLTEQVADYRPTLQANSIAWLLWHSARVQDLQVAGIADVEQVWTRHGWVERFGLDLPRDDFGYGHTAADVAKVRAPAQLLAGYYRDVHQLTLEYLDGITVGELARVVDTAWNPPVTAGVRLVSTLDDCAQHLGQAAYLRGIASRPTDPG
ncbi:mycothiol transferase [Mycolicibacter minnesotensis]